MTGRNRFWVVAVFLLAVLGALTLVVVAGSACPGPTPTSACPDATRNRVTVVLLASLTVVSGVAPFAFLAEFVLRRRIVYRGAWSRAARRGLLAGGVVASMAGLRLGGALSPAVGLFVILLALLVEWFAIRRLDLP